MEPKISIIIPVYNSVNYIKDCLESVICQTLNEIEIIIVDGGSTDGTEIIIREYALKDNRIVIIYSEKKSYGFQNNLGIKKASGTYIAFVESDDIICSDMCSKLYRIANLYNLDYVKGNYMFIFKLSDGEKVTYKISGIQDEYINQIINSSEKPEIFLKDIYIWRGIYSREFLVKYEVQFNETEGAAFQDIGFLFQTISQAKRVYYTDKEVYQYRRDNDASSVYSLNGYRYICQEFEYIQNILDNNPLLRENYQGLIYRRLFDTFNTRHMHLYLSGKMPNGVEDYFSKIEMIFRKGYKDNSLENKYFNKQDMHELNLLVGDVKVYIDYIKEKYLLQKNLFDKFISLCISREQIVVFGAGVIGKYVYQLLNRNKCNNIVSFCDNDVKKWDEKLYNLNIIPVEETINYINCTYIIASNAGMIMEAQLNEMGISGDRIIRYGLGNNLNFLFSYHYSYVINQVDF